MQQDDYGEYDDHEGENTFAEVEDPYITHKEYRCEKCRKSKKESHGVLFAPFCCGRPMKLAHRMEHKFDFESITKRVLEKEAKLFPGSVKAPIKKAKVKKTKVKSSKRKIKKTTVKKKKSKKKR